MPEPNPYPIGQPTSYLAPHLLRPHTQTEYRILFSDLYDEFRAYSKILAEKKKFFDLFKTTTRYRSFYGQFKRTNKYVSNETENVDHETLCYLVLHLRQSCLNNTHQEHNWPSYLKRKIPEVCRDKEHIENLSESDLFKLVKAVEYLVLEHKLFFRTILHMDLTGLFMANKIFTEKSYLFKIHQFDTKHFCMVSII